MSADQRATVGVQHGGRAAHHGGEVVLHFAPAHEWHRGDGECGPRPGTHGMDVGQGMRRGDLTEYEGIVDESAKVIDALHHRHPRRWHRHRGIVGGVEPDRNIPARRRRQSGQRLAEAL